MGNCCNPPPKTDDNAEGENENLVKENETPKNIEGDPVETTPSDPHTQNYPNGEIEDDFGDAGMQNTDLPPPPPKYKNYIEILDNITKRGHNYKYGKDLNYGKLEKIRWSSLYDKNKLYSLSDILIWLEELVIEKLQYDINLKDKPKSKPKIYNLIDKLLLSYKGQELTLVQIVHEELVLNSSQNNNNNDNNNDEFNYNHTPRLRASLYNSNKYSTPNLIAFDKYFLSDKTIGSGAFGRVKIVEKKVNEYQKNKDRYACKFIAKRQLNSNDLNKCYNEINILRRLDNPNIVKCFDFFDGKNKMCFIMEKLDGGELLDQIYYLRQKGRALSERIIANYFIQLINALSYLHEKGIIHRDIKPANLMLVKKSKKYDSPLKLVDFGLAIQLKFKNKEFQKTNEFCGTATFMAPEIYIGKKYDFKVDMWASGIVLYMLLFGCKPFNYNKNRDIKVLGQDIAIRKDNTITDILNRHTKDDRQISKDAINLLTGLLERDPEKRFDTKTVLFHSWFKNASDKDLISKIQKQRLRMEVIQKQFKSGVFAMMALIRIIKTITDSANIDDIISIRTKSATNYDNEPKDTRSKKNNSVVILPKKNKKQNNKNNKNGYHNNNNNDNNSNNSNNSSNKSKDLSLREDVKVLNNDNKVPMNSGELTNGQRNPIYANGNNTQKNNNDQHHLQPVPQNKQNPPIDIDGDVKDVILNDEIYNEALSSVMTDGPLHQSNNDKEPLLPTQPDDDKLNESDDENDLDYDNILKTLKD